MGAEGALFRFGMKSRKLGRLRRPVLHSEEARGAAGALRKYLGALAPKRSSEEMLTWSESSGFLVGNRLMWRSGVKVSRLCYMIVYQTINSIGLEVEQLLMILER